MPGSLEFMRLEVLRREGKEKKAVREEVVVLFTSCVLDMLINNVKCGNSYTRFLICSTMCVGILPSGFFFFRFMIKQLERGA